VNDSPQWTVGGVTITTVIERHNRLPVGDFIPAAAGRAFPGDRAWLSPWALDQAGQLRFVIQAFCLEAEGRKILVDTCIGPRRLPGAYADLADDGSFIEKLTAAGFGRDDVDTVLFTHLHFDHLGWNTILEHARWVPTFRQARYVVAAPEYDHCNAASAEEKAQSNLHSFDDALQPLFAGGVVDLVPADHRLSDAIRLIATPGHTPGHVSVAITSGGESALITGDCAHSPVQLEEPGWYSVADADPDQSSATRRRLVREYADTPVLILGTHFPPPTAGHLVTVDGAVRFRPAPGGSVSTL
jgi:glyoxylase-like metal-dependent hydrolase (beta-lactamase superfamily II)